MIVFNVEQGTPEWHKARAGKITASMFSVARERLKSGAQKGHLSEKAAKYARRLAVERVTGKVSASNMFEPVALRRGKELEPDARLCHEVYRGTMIESCGFACTDCERFGSSADGLIDDGGVVEYKCFEDPDKVMDIFIHGNIDAQRDQVQGHMWIWERDFCDFALYYPDLKKPLRVITEQRNDEYIRELVRDLEEFDRVVESERAALAKTQEDDEPLLQF